MRTRVVFIEDSREIQEAVEDLLGLIGAFDTVASHATEGAASQWLLEHATGWDVALVDLVLREGSGFHLIRRLREANPRGRIIVLSGYASPAVKVRCVELGADAVFTKDDFKSFGAYAGRYAVMPSQAEPGTGERWH